MKEIERKFLIRTVPAELSAGEEIEQLYLSLEPEKRIRRKGKRFFYTEKEGCGLVREEREREIDEAEYVTLSSKTIGKLIYKTRYIIPLEEQNCELDVYSGELTGLITGEVEFKSLNEAEQFVPPAWFGQEITGDKKFSNSHLAMFDIRDK